MEQKPDKLEGEKIKSPDIFSTVQKYALIIGVNSALALQALKFDFFYFPIMDVGENKIDVKLIMGYFLSTLTIICILFSGIELFNKIQESRNILTKLKDDISKNGKKE